MACAAASRRHSSTRRRASALRLDVRACNLRHGTRLSRAMPDESQPSRGGRWKILLQFGVSALAVWLIARRVDLRESAHLVAGARSGYVVAAIALYVVGQVLSAYRWRLIGVSVGLVDSFAHYLRYYFIGMFFMFFGPSTLGGDLVRSLYLAEAAGGRGRAFNSVLFDRLNGLVVLVAIGAAAFLLFRGRYADLPRPLFYVTVAFGAGIFLAWWLAPVLVRLVLPPTHRIRRFVENDLGPFWRDRGMLVGASAVSLVFHFVQIGTQFIVARALGLDVPFTYICIFHPLVSALAAIPITLSGIGLREGGYLLFLQKIGVPQASAVAYAALWFLVIVVSSLLGGVVFVASGARLPRLRRA
ncbi:MAG: flippase-like domain-containing protein [Deltaproteobacteria bacterium]|nr:MAG: flippase-like domain-containing protein [Deltaproteobacteria bacterium]